MFQTLNCACSKHLTSDLTEWCLRFPWWFCFRNSTVPSPIRAHSFTFCAAQYSSLSTLTPTDAVTFSVLLAIRYVMYLYKNSSTDCRPGEAKPVRFTFWHRSFTFNSNKSPTWCNDFSVYYPDVCLQFDMFRVFSRPSSGAQWLQWQPLVLPSYRGDSCAVFVVGPAGLPNHEHSMTITTIRR